MTVRLMKAEDSRAFNYFVDSQNNSSIYHTLRWKKVIEDTYGYKPVYIVATNNNGLNGLLPLFQVRGITGKKRLISIPFSHSVQPLYDSKDTLDSILTYSESIARELNADYVQLKCDLNISQTELDKSKWIKNSSFSESILKLSKPLEDIQKGIKSSTRRNIKKAKKAGIKIKTGTCNKDYMAFYELMTETRKRQGSPPYSKAFFTHLFHNLNSSHIKLFIALKNDKPLAGIIMLYHGLTALYAYGASVSDTELLQMRPNDLLFWTVIKDAWKNKYKYFDFGITHISNLGLQRFKAQWGTVNKELNYTYYLNNINKVPSIDRSGQLARLISGIFRNAPAPLLKITGPIALKFLG